MNVFGDRTTIVSALVGSHNYNLNTEKSDRDYKFFVTPSFNDLYTGTRFSTAVTSERVDYTCHDVRSLVDLLWKANVNFVEVLFSKELVYEPSMEWLFNKPDREKYAQMNLPYFLDACMGMHFQKMGNLFKGTETTKPLVERYGYDTKEACHALRMLYTLEKLSKTGNMANALWFETGSLMHANLMNVKNGDYSLVSFQLLVEVWMENERKNVEDFFRGKTPDGETKGRLDAELKELVRKSL